MTTVLSPDLLDFLGGPLRTYQVRLMRALLDWQMDTIGRTFQGQHPSQGEIDAMLEINQVLADLSAHVYWTVTGKDLEAADPIPPRPPHIWSDYWPQP